MITAFDSYKADRIRRKFNMAKQVFRAKHHRKFKNDIRLLSNYLPVSGVYFDVGANHGRVSLELLRLRGGDCSIYAFEPLPYNQQVIARTLGGKGNVKVFPAAVSNVEETLTAYVPVRGSDGLVEHGSTFIAPASERGRLEGEDILYLAQDVKSVKLDCIVEQNSIDRVDFIKMDVQGHEATVLDGARQLLEKYHPTIIMEIMSAPPVPSVTDPHDQLKVLAEYGYRFYDLDLHEEESWGDDIELIVKRMGVEGCHHDILCWHEAGPVGSEPPAFVGGFKGTSYGR